jgi:EmrB/QacA subfamily drug resistance transporter
MLEQTKAYRQRWIALGFMGVSLLIISLDNSVLNLALPSIAKDLGSSASQLQWIIDAYVLAFAGVLLTMGYLGDRLGRKPTLTVGLVLFALFSLGSALSKSTSMLIVMRALMGISGAMITPATLSILTATFRDSKERAQAIAAWAAVFGLGMGIGPLVGGALLEHYHWSSVFYINIPVIAIGIIGSGIFIVNSKTDNPRRIDFLGTILSITGLFALVYAIIRAWMDGWTETQVLYSFGAAAVLLTAFFIWELKSSYAMLPLHFFKNMSFTGANVAMTLVFFGLMGSFFFMGQFLQSVQGYTPLEAGVRLLPMALTSFVTAMISSRVAGWIGTKYTVGLGILVTALGFFYFAYIAAVDVSYGRLVIAMCLSSLGMGFTMSPATNSVMGSVPVSQSGVGSAMNNTTRQVGAALGVAVLGTIGNSTYLAKVSAVQWPAQLPAQALEAIKGSIQAAHIAAQNIPVPQLSKMIIDQTNLAFTAGAKEALLIGSFIMVASSIITLIILPNKVRPPDMTDDKNK